MKLPNSLRLFLNREAQKLMPLVGSALRFRWTRPVRAFIRKHLTPQSRAIQIAVTYKCQSRCKHCGVGKYRQKGRKELTTGELKSLLDQMREMDFGVAYFFGGDPLIREDLEDLIKYAHDLGMYTRLDTNGLALTKEKVASLKAAGLDRIGVSLDSADPAVHDKNRGVKGIFEKAWNGLKEAKAAGIYTYISTYACHETLDDGSLADLVEMGRQNGVRSRILSPIMAGRWQQLDMRLDSGEEEKLLDLLGPDRGYWENDDCVHGRHQFICAATIGKNNYVSAYGDVQPCCYIPFSFGNIRKEPLKVIMKRMWAHPMLRDFAYVSGCPMNEEEFRRRYIDRLVPGENLPKELY